MRDWFYAHYTLFSAPMLNSFSAILSPILWPGELTSPDFIIWTWSPFNFK